MLNPDVNNKLNSVSYDHAYCDQGKVPSGLDLGSGVHVVVGWERHSTLECWLQNLESTVSHWNNCRL